MRLNQILQTAMKKGASDVHLKANTVPLIRKHGRLRPIGNKMAALLPEEIDQMAALIMNDNQRQQFLKNKEFDFSHAIENVGRFRVNVYKQSGHTHMVIRNIPEKIPSFADLNLPEVLAGVATRERGLILVTGATGQGKSSTLAAMVNHINQHESKHIVTIEDPIEYKFSDIKSTISQREIGTDAIDFTKSLRAALRQDPDVILIGEMRDRETIETALLAAETGHLVLSTLHTTDAQETVNRILGQFGPNHQSQIRRQLASCLAAVISQRLAIRSDDRGYVPAVEILIGNARVRNMIEEPERSNQILRAIEEGSVTYGMQSFDQSLMDLVVRGLIEYDTAYNLSSRPEDFAIRYSGVTEMSAKKWSDNTQNIRRVANVWQDISELELDNDDKTLTKIRKND